MTIVTCSITVMLTEVIGENTEQSFLSRVLHFTDCHLLDVTHFIIILQLKMSSKTRNFQVGLLGLLNLDLFLSVSHFAFYLTPCKECCTTWFFRNIFLTNESMNSVMQM